MNITKDQRGMSAVEIIGACLVVIVIGAVGFFVFQHNRTKPTSAAATNTTTTNTTPETNTQQTNQTTQTQTDTTTVPITELGIQLSLPASIKDLTYQSGTTTQPNGDKETFARLSTASLGVADPKCGSDSGALGAIGVTTGQYPTGDNAAGYAELVKQFPTFFVTYRGPQGGCSTSKDVLASQSADRGALESALPSVQALN